MSSPTPLAILVPDPRFAWPGYDGAGTSTTYSEADPEGAGPVALLAGAAVLTGEQSAPVELQFVRGGAPDQSRAARVVWSEVGGSAYGWVPPVFLFGLTPVGLSGYGADMLALPDGRLLVVAPSATGAGAVYQCVVFDPADDTSTSPVNTGISTAADRALVALRYEPEDGSVWLLAQQDPGSGYPRRFRLARSADLGATWTQQGDAVFTGTPPLSGTEPAVKCRWFVASGQHYLYVVEANDGGGSAGDSVVSVYSSVGGSVWSYVAGLTARVGGGQNANACDVLLTVGGRVVLAINELVSATNTLRVYLTAPGGDPAQGTPAELSTTLGLVTSLDLLEEDTGRLWLLATDSAGDVETWRSIDGGLTWQPNANRQVRRGSVDSSWCGSRARNSGGTTYLLARGYAAAASGALVLLRLGGWSQVEPYAVGGSTPQQPADPNRLTWGVTAAGSVDWGSASALPWQVPGSQGWTAAGAGSEVAAYTGLTVTTTANTRTFEALSAAAGTARPQVTALAQVRQVSGGSGAATNIGLRLRACLVGGVSDVGLDVRVNSTSLVVVDAVSGSTLGSWAVGTTSDVTVWALIDGAYCEVYARRPYDPEWVQLVEGGLTTTPSTGAFVRWGHLASATAESVWSWVGSAWSVPGSDPTGDYWRSSLSSSAAKQALLGRPVAAVAAPLGDPALWPALALVGLAQPGEAVVAPPSHQRPVVHLDPAQYPSRTSVWRSVDTAEQIVEFRPGAATSPGRSVALAVVGANWRTTYLERWTGSAWATVATLDLAVTTSGNATLLAAGADVALLQGIEVDAGELIGGTLVFASGDYRRIVANTAGVVVAPGARVRFAGADGTETDGTCTVLASTGAVAAAAHNVSDRWRVRIPSQTTAEGYFEAAKVLIGGWVQPGLNDEHGRVVQVSPTVDQRGDLRTRRRAPGRTFALQFPSQVLLRDTESYQMGVGGGYTGFLGDTYPLLDALLCGPSDGPGLDTLPCLVVFAPETSAGVLNWRRRQVLYGQLEGGPAQTWVAGLEDEQTVDRPDRLTFRELV